MQEVHNRQDGSHSHVKASRVRVTVVTSQQKPHEDGIYY